MGGDLLGVAEQLRQLIVCFQEIDLSEVAAKSDIQQLENRFDRVEARLRELELRMTIKLGTLIAAGIAVLAAMNYFAH